MSSISFEEFDGVLSKLNGNLRTFPSRSKRSSMIYERRSYHPDSGLYGLCEVCGYPSPFHGSFPKYDFIDKAGRVARGYISVFKLLVRKRLINKDRLREILPQALDAARGRPTSQGEKDAPPPIPVYAAPVRDTGVELLRNPRKHGSAEHPQS